MVRQQSTKALAQVVIKMFCKSHFLYSRQLTVAWPNLFTGGAEILQDRKNRHAHNTPAPTRCIYQDHFIRIKQSRLMLKKRGKKTKALDDRLFIVLRMNNNRNS